MITAGCGFCNTVMKLENDHDASLAGCTFISTWKWMYACLVIPAFCLGNHDTHPTIFSDWSCGP
jgi:hypothetical protein